MPPTPFVFDADGQFVPPPPRPISTPLLPPGFTSEGLENFVELQSTRNVLAAVKAAEQEKKAAKEQEQKRAAEEKNKAAEEQKKAAKKQKKKDKKEKKEKKEEQEAAKKAGRPSK